VGAFAEAAFGGSVDAGPAARLDRRLETWTGRKARSLVVYRRPQREMNIDFMSRSTTLSKTNPPCPYFNGKWASVQEGPDGGWQRLALLLTSLRANANRRRMTFSEKKFLEMTWKQLWFESRVWPRISSERSGSAGIGSVVSVFDDGAK